MSTVCPLLGYPDIRLAISLSSASSFHVNLLLMACTATLLYDTVLWVLQLRFSTKASDFTLSYCAGTKIENPAPLRPVGSYTEVQFTLQSIPWEQAETRLCNHTLIWFLVLFSLLSRFSWKCFHNKHLHMNPHFMVCIWAI